MDVEPFCDIISVTERIAYGKSSTDGKTAVKARSAKYPCPISLRPGDPRRFTSPTV